MYDSLPPPEEENEDDLKPLYNPATQDYKNSPVDEFDIDILEDNIEAIYNPETMKFLAEMEPEDTEEDTH